MSSSAPSCSCRERLAGVECSPHEREAQGGGGGGGGGGGEDFTDAALDTAGAEQRAAYEAAVVAHEEEEVPVDGTARRVHPPQGR